MKTFKLYSEPVAIQLTVHINNIVNSTWTHWNHMSRNERKGVMLAYIANPEKNPIKGSVGDRMIQLFDYYGYSVVNQWFKDIYGVELIEEAS